MSTILEDRYYTEKHEWAKKEGDVLLVGITDFAQNSLGDIVYVDVRQPDEQIQRGESMGTIESVKAAEDIYAPVSGTVTEINSTVNDSPESVNSDPYGSWLLKVKDFDESELSEMMSAEKYRQYLDSLEV